MTDEQEPMTPYSDIVSDGGLDPRNKFDAAPQRQWVGLTVDEIALINADYPHPQGFARAIEAKLKQKNGYAEEKNT